MSAVGSDPVPDYRCRGSIPLVNGGPLIINHYKTPIYIMAIIKLSNGTETIIDDDLVDFVSQWKFGGSKKGYVRANVKRDGVSFFVSLHFCVMHSDLESKSAVELHRLEVRKKSPVPVIDHINRNPLDNRRDNLRHATPYQNCLNVTKRKGLASKYLGVSISIDKGGKRKRWMARLMYDKRYVFYKAFPFTKAGEIAAARARDAAALKFHREFASLNFPENE